MKTTTLVWLGAGLLGAFVAFGATAVERPPGMELTFGNDTTPAAATLFKALSVSSVESYVDWAGVEPKENHWDWRKWDAQVATLQRAGLKWVPFLIAGPAYAAPLWFQNGFSSHFFQCLEHSQTSRMQSIFNPNLRPQVERFIQALAKHYATSNIIASVLLGITGIYGESIYPAGPEGDWPERLTGPYHNITVGGLATPMLWRPFTKPCGDTMATSRR